MRIRGIHGFLRPELGLSVWRTIDGKSQVVEKELDRMPASADVCQTKSIERGAGPSLSWIYILGKRLPVESHLDATNPLVGFRIVTKGELMAF